LIHLVGIYILDSKYKDRAYLLVIQGVLNRYGIAS